MPVYQLLGGAYRKRIELYANYWFIAGEGTSDEYRRQIQPVLEQNFAACKLDPCAHTSYLYGSDLREDLSLTEYVFEPPGETHTLTVDADVEEMITFFQISGCMYYVNEQGNHTGFADVFTKIDMCRRHYTSVGLGDNYVDRFIR